jgi:hypothetical protein
MLNLAINRHTDSAFKLCTDNILRLKCEGRDIRLIAAIKNYNIFLCCLTAVLVFYLATSLKQQNYFHIRKSGMHIFLWPLAKWAINRPHERHCGGGAFMLAATFDRHEQGL